MESTWNTRHLVYPHVYIYMHIYISGFFMIECRDLFIQFRVLGLSYRTNERILRECW